MSGSESDRFRTPEATPAIVRRSRTSQLEDQNTPTRSNRRYTTNTTTPTLPQATISYTTTFGMGESFSLSSKLALKGAINYLDWKEAMNATIKGHGLGRFINSVTRAEPR